MIHFRKLLHANLIFQTERMPQGHPKSRICIQKTAENWQTALFSYFCLLQLFATKIMRSM